MIRKLSLVLVLGLGACTGLDTEQTRTATQALAAACNSGAAAVRIAENRYRAGALGETGAKVVDYSVAVIDGFCAPGTPVPRNLDSAVKAVSQAGANIMALGF